MLFSGLSLIVIEVGGDCDNGLCDLLAELCLCNLLHLFAEISVDRFPAVCVLTFISTMEDISWGENVLVSPRYSTCTIGLPPWSTILKGHDSISFLTVGSSNLRPINRLACYISSCTILLADLYVLDIKDSIGRVHSGLVLCSLTNETLLLGERDK